MVVPVLAGLVALLVLGLHPPGELTGLLDRAVAAAPGAGVNAAPGPASLPARPGAVTLAAGVPALWDCGDRRGGRRRRFAGLMATQRPAGLALSAHVAGPGGIATREAVLPPGAGSYPALSPALGAAFWYEREIHDLFGVVPDGHPRLEPLILPLLDEHAPRPQPGAPGPAPAAIWPDEHSIPRHVMGPGLFTIPHGPVRSGVMESIEYLVETPGEDIAAPEHAGVLQAPRHRETIRAAARGRRRAARRTDRRQWRR